MKKFSSVLLAGVLLFPAVLSAAPFEGSMHVKLISPGKDKPVEIDYLIKNNRARVTPQLGQKEGAMAMIMDYEKLEVLMLMSEQKMYMTMPIKTAIESATKENEKYTLEKTGEKEKILGHTCEKYRTKSTDSSTTDMWLTDEIGTFAGLGTGAGGGGRQAKGASMQAWEKALAGKNLFPLRVVGSTAAGKETFRMEVTAVHKESVPESALIPPADFKKFEMPAMGDMMKGMMKGMIPGSR